VEKMLVAVFDDRTRANEGAEALDHLDSDGSISIHAEAEIKKNADGSVTIEDAWERTRAFPVRTATGTAIGSLIGVLGGPIGVGVGAAAGSMVGYVADMQRAGVNVDYLNDVSQKFTPGKWAIVSDVNEESQTPVDMKMEALGGTVFRATREDVENEQDARDLAALNSEIAQVKEERDRSKANERSKLQKKIDSLNYKLHQKTQKAKEDRERRRKEDEAKIHALEEKAKKARGDEKKKLEDRIASIRKSIDETLVHEGELIQGMT